MGQEFVVPSFNTNRYYNKNTDSIAVLPTGATAGSVMFIGSTGTLAQDNANFYFNDTTNALLLGSSTTPGTAYGRAGQLFEENASATNGGAALNTWSATAATHAPIFDFNRSKSSTVGTHAIVASGDSLGFIVFRGSDGTAFRDSASIVGEVDGTPGASDMPGRLVFRTTADGAASLTTRLTIDSLGRIQQQVEGAAAQALTGSTFVVSKSQTGITTVGSGRYFSLQNTSGSVNQVVEIGFGYIGAGVNQPVLIGHKVSNATAFTKGSLYMAVRDVTTDTAPTEVWTLDSTGQVTQNMPAAASTAETLHTWKVSDDATSKIQINNLSSTNGVFIPRVDWISSGTNQASFQIFQGTTDTGTTPLLDFYARIGAGTTVATRPLFRIQNNGTEKWSMAADGAITQTITSTASTAETLHTWTVSDDATSKISIDNATAVDGNFLPRLNFVQSGTSANFLTFQGTTDTGAAAVGIINVKIGAATAVTTRPMLQIQNNSTGKWVMSANGAIAQVITSAASTAETLHTWSVSDDATSLIKIFNGSASDSVFSPVINTVSAGNASSIVHQAQQATDTTTNAAFTVNSFLTGPSALATRPLFQVQNSSTAKLIVHGTTKGGALETLGGRISFLRSVTSTTITVAVTDHIVLSSTGGGAVAVSLPASPETGREYTIKDNVGDAATNNITVTPAAGNIDGAGTYVMNANYEAATFVYNGTQWNVVSSHN